MRFLNLFYLIICFVTFSCNGSKGHKSADNPEFNEMNARSNQDHKSSDHLELNELNAKLNSLEIIFNEMELLEYEKASNGFDENLKLIQSCNDSVSTRFVNLINQYKVIKKARKPFILEYDFLAVNIKMEREQLNFLIKDVNNGLIPKDSVDFYVKKEKQHIIQISDETNNVYVLYNEIMSAHDSLYLKIKELANNNCL